MSIFEIPGQAWNDDLVSNGTAKVATIFELTNFFKENFTKKNLNQI